MNRYREQFVGVSDSVVTLLRILTTYPIQSRHKSIPSIVAKLRRKQPARLSAIQDMAGARIRVFDAIEQDEIVRAIGTRFPGHVVDDKRRNPVYGYRAVHVIVPAPLPYEIQVRTITEHWWAQLSERLADDYGFELKYGGGPVAVREALLAYSEFLATLGKLFSDDRRGIENEQALRDVRDWLAHSSEILKVLKI